MLYHILMDLEEFLVFKRRFVDGLDDKSENYTGIIKLSFVKKNVLWHILFDTFRSSNS